MKPAVQTQHVARQGADKLLLACFIISAVAHGALLGVFSVTDIVNSFIDEIKPVEVTLPLDPYSPVPDKAVKEDVPIPSKNTDALITAKERVPDLKQKQEIPQAAKGEKPGDKANILDKGIVGDKYSKEGSPNGAEEGWTWGGDKMTMVKTITPQNRVDKTKSFSVIGEAEIKAVPDKAFVQGTIETRAIDLKSAIDSGKVKLEYVRKKISLYNINNIGITGRFSVKLKEWGTPKIEKIVTAYKRVGVEKPTGSDLEYVAGGETWMEKMGLGGAGFAYRKEPIYNYRVIQNATLELSEYFSSPKKMLEIITYCESLGLQLITSTVIPPSAQQGESMAQAGTGSTISVKAASEASVEVSTKTTEEKIGQDGVVSYGFETATKEKLKKQVIETAVENAKKKAVLMARQLGISIKEITPLIEEQVSFGKELDESRQITITGKVILYF